MRHAANILVAIFIISLSACGGGGGSSSSSDSSGGSGGGSGGGIDSQMVGTWKSVCVLPQDAEQYLITTIAYSSGGSAVETVLFYTDSACSSATGLKKVNQSSYSFGDNVTASGKSAYEIDITINSWKLTKNGSTITSGTNVPTLYDLVAVEGKTLYIYSNPNPTPITSPANRPTTLNLENYYTRQ